MKSGHMLDRVASRLQQRRGGARLDLRIAEARDRGKGNVDILVRFNEDDGVPTRTEIAAFVNDRFKGMLTAGDMAAYKTDSPRDGAVMVEACLHQNRLPLEYMENDPSSWQNLDTEGSRVMNVRTAEVWTVDRDEQGRPTMFRAAQEDLEELLRAANSDRLRTAMPSVTFEKIGVSASACIYDIGDMVQYHCRGTVCTGRVVNCEYDAHGKKRYHIENSDGQVDMIAGDFMLAVVEKGVASQADDIARQAKIYQRIYPSADFANRLTPKLHKGPR